MQLTILYFGLIAEAINCSKEVIETSIITTFELEKRLLELHPILKTVTYKMAVNKELLINEITIKEKCEIALLPPFSGG